MKTRLCVFRLGYGGSESIPQQIATAVEEEGREPDEVHFSSAQTTASGGQFGHYAALLVWRKRDADKSIERLQGQIKTLQRHRDGCVTNLEAIRELVEEHARRFPAAKLPGEILAILDGNSAP